MQQKNLHSLHNTVPPDTLYPKPHPLPITPTNQQNYLLHNAPTRLMRFLRTEYLNSVLLPFFNSPTPTHLSMYDAVSDLTSTHITPTLPIPLSRLANTFTTTRISHKLPPAAQLSHLLSPSPIPPSPLGSLLNAAACNTTFISPIILFMESLAWYDLFPEEYITRLHKHLTTFMTTHSSGVILEIAAGDGRLSAYLNVPRNKSRLHVIPSDDNTWGYNTKGVTKLTAGAALAAIDETKPASILVSWPPLGVDFTEEFRGTLMVAEYYVIGDPTCTGTRETWGEHEGWRRTVLEECVAVQVCRYDNHMERASRTIKYERL